MTIERTKTIGGSHEFFVCYCGVEKRSITSYFCHTMALDKLQHVAVACIGSP